MLAFFGALVLSAVGDLLSCEWQSARERGQLVRIGWLSAAIEIVNWIPVYIVIVTHDLALVAATILGSVVGSVVGGVVERRRRARRVTE